MSKNSICKIKKENLKFKSLEDILIKYFKCKGSPFLKKPKQNQDGDYVKYFTKSGAAAYIKLETLLDDLEVLGVFEGCDTDSETIVENLDEIVRHG